MLGVFPAGLYHPRGYFAFYVGIPGGQRNYIDCPQLLGFPPTRVSGSSWPSPRVPYIYIHPVSFCRTVYRMLSNKVQSVEDVFLIHL